MENDTLTQQIQHVKREYDMIDALNKKLQQEITRKEEERKELLARISNDVNEEMNKLSLGPQPGPSDG